MFTLPDDKDAKVAVLNHLRDSSASVVSLYKVRWLINHYWLMGIRSFFPDYATGMVTFHLYNQQTVDGHLILRYEDVVVKLQEELGRLMRMDIRPSTAARGHGLDRVRAASAGKVILEYLSAPTDWGKLKESLFYHLAVYGTVGIGCWVKAENYPGLVEEEEGKDHEKEEGEHEEAAEQVHTKARLEIIPAWELYPIPHNPDSNESVRGHLRKRWVTLDWLKTQKNLKLPRGEAEKPKLEIRMSPYGVRPSDQQGFAFSQLPRAASPIGQPTDPNITGGAKKRDVEYVLLEEYYFLGDEKDKLCRWVVKVGNWVAADETYEDRNVYCPIGIARYHPIGGYYGRSFVELIIPVASEVEQMLANLFQNVKDLDAFGILMMPNGAGISKNELLKKDRTRKVCFYDPDPAMDGKDKAYAINPVTTNDFPGKVAAMGNQIIDRLTRSSEMMRGEAPGRVDSAQGLGFLNEMTNIPLSVPAKSVANALAQVYKALLAAAPDLLGDGGEVPLIGLDDSIVGLIVKPSSGVVELNPANFPLPSQLEVGIRDELPSPPTIRIQKLLESFKMQLMTPLEFKITVWKENLDFPVGSWAEQEAYRKSVLQTILLFGDGEQPGQVIASMEADNPKIALLVLQQFMAKPEFTFAGIRVREAFEQLKQAYQGMLQAGYPEPMAYPEDEAMLSQQLQKQMRPPGGGQPGPAMGAGRPMPAGKPR